MIAALRYGFVLALVGACNSTTTNQQPLTPEATESALHASYCSVMQRCGLIDDPATCGRLPLQLPLDANIEAAIASGKILFDADQARLCINALAAWTCDKNVAFTDHAMPESCLEMLSGTVDTGGTCATDHECVTDRCAVPACSMACCQGTCVAGDPLLAHAGEPCGAETTCINSYCTSSSVCALYLVPGATCDASDQCGPGSTCSGGICQGLSGPGESCSNTESCRDVGERCNQTSFTCVAVGLTGAPCAGNGDCAPLYSCGPSLLCVEKAHLGQPCTTSCIDATYCEPATHTCTQPKAEGAACAANAECASASCDAMSMTCAAAAVCI